MQILIGLIGCGHWGQRILTNLVTLGAAVTVCDTDDARRKWAIQNGATATTCLLSELYACAGLIVATPASTHGTVLSQIASMNIPLFVEKPLTTSYPEALEISKLLLPPTFMMHIWRYHPGIQLMTELAETGEIGDVLLLKTTRTNWTSPRLDTDSVWTLAPHDLTIARNVLGYMPTPKAAVIERHGTAIRGLTALLGNRPQVVIDISTRYADKRREVRLHGTEGVAVLASETADYIELWRGNDQSSPKSLPVERIFFDATPPLQLELAAFLAYLAGGPAPISDLAEGIEVVRILDELVTLAG